MKEIHIIYASTTGNTEAVCDTLNALLTQKGYTSVLHRAEETELTTITQNKYFILATSTWGHGMINPYYDELLAGIKYTDCKGKFAGFVGLGDHAYEEELFNRGIDTLKSAFIASGGAEIGNDLKIDGDPFSILDTKVPFWLDKYIAALENVPN